MYMQVNTAFVELMQQGVNHSEGGWPKDVAAADPEQTARYRRKLEKDEQFAVQMMSLAEVRRPCVCGTRVGATHAFTPFHSTLLTIFSNKIHGNNFIRQHPSAFL